MGVEFFGIDETIKKLKILATPKNLDLFFNKCIKELAVEFLQKAIGFSPRDTGTLKRGFIATKEQRQLFSDFNQVRQFQPEPTIDDIINFLKNIKVTKKGSKYTITIENPVYYAEQVNYGHLTMGLFIEKAEDYVNMVKDEYLSKRLENYLKDVF